MRKILAVRERHQDYRSEFKFERIGQGNYQIVVDLLNAIEQTDAHVAATVVDSTYDPFRGRDPWDARAAVISQLVIGNINPNENAVVLMDGVSTPENVSIGTAIKRRVNTRLGAGTVVTAFGLDSKANDLLQLADLVAGAVRHTRTNAGRPVTSATGKLKAQVAKRVALAFEIDDLADQRSARVNILTMSRPRRDRNRLSVVAKRSVS
jgi:hypothetical protein